MKEATVDDKMIHHFNGISDHYYDIVDRIWYDFGYYHRKEIEFVIQNLEQFNNNKFIKILDAGCGPGRHTIELARRGYTIISLDFSKGMLKRCRKNVENAGLLDKVNFIQGDIRFLPFKSNKFDLIINMEVLEHLSGHLKDAKKVIHEFNRITIIKGFLIIEVPNKLHSYLRMIRFTNPSWKEIKKEEREELYRKNPIIVGNSFSETVISSFLFYNKFKIVSKSYIRVIPAGLVERIPFFDYLDKCAEKIVFLNKFSREIIWYVQKIGELNESAISK